MKIVENFVKFIRMFIKIILKPPKIDGKSQKL